MKKRPLIISTDPGIDDAVALTIALFASELDVQLIVPTYGNVAIEQTLRNTLQLEAFLKTKVPVVQGAQGPLLRTRINAASVHGKSGMDGFTFPEPNWNLLQTGLAATAIHEQVLKNVQPTTFLQIGPATDLALYLQQYPQDKKRIAEIVIMGGNWGRGNWGPHGEFNLASDPEAAQIVLQSGLPLKLAPLELGQQAFIKMSELKQLAKRGPKGKMAAAILLNLQDISAAGGREIYDALACGLLLVPEIYQLQAANVQVITQTGPAYGASAIDFSNYYGQPANAQVGVKVDRDQFAAWFLTAITKDE